MKKLIFKRFDSTLPTPLQATKGAAGIDLYARTTVTIQPGEVAFVPLNIAMKPPAGHWILLAARSSLFKKGASLINGIGIGDEDYCGDNDEYQAALHNFTTKPVVINRGDRIVQMVIMQKSKVELHEVDRLENQDRGGFGSTG